jgi:hypothetical protein
VTFNDLMEEMQVRLRRELAGALSCDSGDARIDRLVEAIDGLARMRALEIPFKQAEGIAELLK